MSTISCTITSATIACEISGIQYGTSSIDRNSNLVVWDSTAFTVDVSAGFLATRKYNVAGQGKFYNGAGTEYTGTVNISALATGEFIVLITEDVTDTYSAVKGTGDFKDYLANHSEDYLFVVNMGGELFSPIPSVQTAIDDSTLSTRNLLFCDPGGFTYAKSGANTVTISGVNNMRFYFGDGVERTVSSVSYIITENDGFTYIYINGATGLSSGQYAGVGTEDALQQYIKLGYFPIFLWNNNTLKSFYPEIQSRIEYLTHRDASNLVDGASIALDCLNADEKRFNLSTAQSAITATLSNVIANSIIDLTVTKTIAGDCTVTLAGTGLTFRGYNDGAYASTPAVVLSGATNDFFTISIKVTGLTAATNKVCMVSLGEKAN